MKIIHLLILLCICLLAYRCNYGVSYNESEKNGWHIINLGAFSVETPKSYKYQREQGIDSFVGEIKNSSIKFSFDFGNYSPKGPKDKVEYVEEHKNRIDILSEALFLSMIDLSPYINEGGGYNPTKVLEQIKDLKTKKYSDTVELSINLSEKPEFYYEFKYLDQEYKIPLQFDEFTLKDIENYTIAKDTINGIARRFFWSKDLSNKPSAGVYLVDLDSFESDRNNYIKKLFFYTRDLNQATKSEIMEILETVKINR